jgi:threonine/homoserine/homoserine lactone efflux protein
MVYLFAFFLGFLLSFLGQLPLGTISMTATQIAVQENFRNAWKYSAGVALIEMIYLRLILSAIGLVMNNHTLVTVFSWITALFFISLGVISFVSAHRQHPDKKALLLDNRLDRFILGIGISILNPAQIPFWFIWSGYFLNQGWLPAGFNYFNVFTLGSALGTIGGLAVYIYGGNWVVLKMKTSNQTLNKIIGIVFALAAIIQIFRIFWP